MKKTMNWGIIGCGSIANTFAESAAVLADVEIVAAASRTPGKGKAFAAKHAIKNHYSDYAELLVNDEAAIPARREMVEFEVGSLASTE